MAYGTVNADVIGTSVAGSNLGAGDASLMKNRIINGAMMISQYNGTSSSTPVGDGYFIDRYRTIFTGSTKFTVGQNLNSVTPPTGFINYLGLQVATAGSIGASDFNTFVQYIEGVNVSDLAWGTANAKTVTLSFQVYSNITGTFGGALQNSAQNRSYPFTYTISSANTWTSISITVAGDTSGTWLTTTGVGIRVCWSLGTGTTYSGTAGSWAGADYRSATGATTIMASTSNIFYITGVQLEVGSSATGFEYRQYQQELTLCQRYFESSYSIGTAAGSATSTGLNEVGGTADNATNVLVTTKFVVAKRTEPTMVAYTSGGASNTVLVYNTSNPTGISKTPVWEFVSTANAAFYVASSGGTWLANTIKFQWTASAEL